VSDTRSSPDNLNWLLDNLLKTVPGTRGALLLSTDGLKKSFVGFDDNAADKLSAMASGLHSIGRGVGTSFGDGGTVLQVVVELTTTLLFVSSGGSGTVLAVLAEPNTDAGQLGYEMARLVKQVPTFLATPARQPMGMRLDGGA
jgi:predicted regulator of Ras-like GTPase activity (Roadblock/LC7/MglB family)